MAPLASLLLLSLVAIPLADAGTLLAASNKNDVIPNAYIVIMKDNTSARSFRAHTSWVAEIHHNNMTRQSMGFHGDIRYQYDFERMKGYSGRFDQTAIQQIVQSPDVDYVEPDMVVRLSAIIEQRNVPSWGLARVSSPDPANRNYRYDDSAGDGVTAYVVDTGVDISHPDFEGRATWGSNQVDNVNRDEHGHGTHVGGTIAGRTFGVAKRARPVAVKVLNGQGQGSISGIIAGIDWSVNHARQNGILRRSTMNMSLGGARTASLNTAARRAAEAGIFVAVAAGNDGGDASRVSPASEPAVCTVGASDQRNAATSWSNYGRVVDVYAPGNEIVSAAPGGGTATMSGTSMASPHVCGLGAYLIRLEGGITDVCGRIRQLAQPAVRNAPSGTTRGLINNGAR